MQTHIYTPLLLYSATLLMATASFHAFRLKTSKAKLIPSYFSARNTSANLQSASPTSLELQHTNYSLSFLFPIFPTLTDLNICLACFLKFNKIINRLCNKLP